LRARDPPQQVLDDGNRFAAGDQRMAELRQERQELRCGRVGAPVPLGYSGHVRSALSMRLIFW
jgi:hypothetical protein